MAGPGMTGSLGAKTSKAPAHTELRLRPEREAAAMRILGPMLTETRITSYCSCYSEAHWYFFREVGQVCRCRCSCFTQGPNSLDGCLSTFLQDHPSSLHRHGGNVHTLGTCGPHSGLDLESERPPFSELLPGLPYLQDSSTRDGLLHRYQAEYPHDKGVAGSYVSGKFNRYVDHSANSNRGNRRYHMKQLGIVEAASYKTSTPITCLQLTIWKLSSIEDHTWIRWPYPNRATTPGNPRYFQQLDQC